MFNLTFNELTLLGPLASMVLILAKQFTMDSSRKVQWLAALSGIAVMVVVLLYTAGAAAALLGVGVYLAAEAAIFLMMRSEDARLREEAALYQAMGSLAGALASAHRKV